MSSGDHLHPMTPRPNELRARTLGCRIRGMWAWVGTPCPWGVFFRHPPPHIKNSLEAQRSTLVTRGRGDAHGEHRDCTEPLPFPGSLQRLHGWRAGFCGVLRRYHDRETPQCRLRPFPAILSRARRSRMQGTRNSWLRAPWARGIGRGTGVGRQCQRWTGMTGER